MTEEAKLEELERFSAVRTARILVVDDHPIVVATGSPTELVTMAEMVRRYARQVLVAAGDNKTHATRILGMDRRSLYRPLEESGAIRISETW